MVASLSNQRGILIDTPISVDPPFGLYIEYQGSQISNGVLLATSQALAEGVEFSFAIQQVDGKAQTRWAYNQSFGVFYAVITGTTDITDGSKHRIFFYAETASGNTFLHLYVDGANEGDVTISSDITTLHFDDLSAVGGVDTISTAPAAWSVFGSVAHAAFFDRDFNPTEAANLSSGVSTPADFLANILGWWKLDYAAYSAVVGGIGATVDGNVPFSETPPTITGTLPQLTSDMTALSGEEVDATLSGTLPALEAAIFNFDVIANLDGSFPALEAEFINWDIVDPILASVSASLPNLVSEINVHREVPPTDDIEVGFFVRMIGWRNFPVRWPPPV